MHIYERTTAPRTSRKATKLLGKRKPSDSLAREIHKAAASCERRSLSSTAQDRSTDRQARRPSTSWPRKHPYCVEECDILTPEHYMLKWKYLPDMVLVARRDGVAMKYYLVCQQCGSRSNISPWYQRRARSGRAGFVTA